MKGEKCQGDIEIEHLLVTQKVMSGAQLNHYRKQFPHHEQRTIYQNRELLALFLVVQEYQELHSLTVRTTGEKRSTMPQHSFSLKSNKLLLFGIEQIMG